MSPALAHECPYTPPPALPCKPHVRAGLYTPRGLSLEGAPSHALVEAPCSALAIDTAEERLCPCKSRSTMLRAGDKQLRVASRLQQPQGEPPGSVLSLTALLSLRRLARGGLGTGATLRSRLAYATLPGPTDLVFACLSRARAHRGEV